MEGCRFGDYVRPRKLQNSLIFLLPSLQSLVMRWCCIPIFVVHPTKPEATRRVFPSPPLIFRVYFFKYSLLRERPGVPEGEETRSEQDRVNRPCSVCLAPQSSIS